MTSESQVTGEKAGSAQRNVTHKERTSKMRPELLK